MFIFIVKEHHYSKVNKNHLKNKMKWDLITQLVGLGGVVATYLPQDSRFTGSNPTEVNGFFQDVKVLSTSPPGGTFSWGSRV